MFPVILPNFTIQHNSDSSQRTQVMDTIFRPLTPFQVPVIILEFCDSPHIGMSTTTTLYAGYVIKNDYITVT